MLRHTFLATWAFASLSSAQTYTLADSYTPANFFDRWTFFTGPDPTHGFVEYIDQASAVSRGLIPDVAKARWTVDTTTVNIVNGTGRASIRLTSKKTYNHGLFIADINHMPDSTCGSWPAMWFFGQDGVWPQSGEFDVIEGVNNMKFNTMSAHTKPGCLITGGGQTGTLQTTDCAVQTSTTGCSSTDPRTTSYGTGFNGVQGGIYATEWTSQAITVWFFPRDAIPASITAKAPTPAVDFGTPVAVFSGSCDMDTMFYDMAMVFDTTFCGDWGAAVYQKMGCPMTPDLDTVYSCVSYVANNPSAFAEQYWDLNGIDVYQTATPVNPNGDGDGPVKPPPPKVSHAPPRKDPLIAGQSIAKGGSLLPPIFGEPKSPAAGSSPAKPPAKPQAKPAPGSPPNSSP